MRIEARKLRSWFERWGLIFGIVFGVLLNERILHYSGWKGIAVEFLFAMAFFLPFVKFQWPKKKEVPSPDYLVLLNGERLPLDLHMAGGSQDTHEKSPEQ